MNAPSAAFRLAVRAAALLAVAGTVAFLLSMAIVPAGFLSITYDLVDPAPFVSAPKPGERLTAPSRDEKGRTYRALVGDPLYFDLTPPSEFDAVTVNVTYANTGNPVFELGALGSAIDEQFDMRPAENRTLDSLPWARVSSGDLTLLQRVRTYASVDDFFRKPPPTSDVATYRFDSSIPYSIPGYVPSGKSREIDVSLRGNHRLLTYVKDEPLSLSFVTQDMNRKEGADPVIVSVYRGGDEEPVARTVLSDDGNTRDDQRSSKLRSVAVSLTAPEEGAYRIEFTASADVFIRKVVTRQRKLAFLGRLYIGDHVGYSDRLDPVTLFVGGRRIIARTAHPESLQVLRVGDGTLSLEQPNLRYMKDVRSRREPAAVVSPKRDVLLETDGVFAFSQDEYFDPLPLSMEWYTAPEDLDAEGIDYVLTTYEPPQAGDGAASAQATFDVARLAKTTEGAYRFVLTAPGIMETLHEFRLMSVTFEMRRAPIGWNNLWERTVSLFSGSAPSPVLVLPTGRSYGESPQ